MRELNEQVGTFEAYSNKHMLILLWLMCDI